MLFAIPPTLGFLCALVTYKVMPYTVFLVQTTDPTKNLGALQKG